MLLLGEGSLGFPTHQKNTHTVQQQTQSSALQPLLDTDCRIQTNARKQTEPPPVAQRMRAGGAQLGLLGGLFNVPGKRHTGMLYTNNPVLPCVDGVCVCVCVVEIET